MIDYTRLGTDRSYRTGVKDALVHIREALELPQLTEAISKIEILDESIQKAKMASRQQESNDMEGTPVSC